MNDRKEYSFDVFISYSDDDYEWVHNVLLKKLDTAKLRVCFDNRDFDPGIPNLDNIERALKICKHILLVMTPAWLNDELKLYQSILFQTTDPAALQRRLIPLLLEMCKPPERIKMLTYVDFTRSDNQELQLNRVVKAVKGSLSLHDIGPRLEYAEEFSTEIFENDLITKTRNQKFIEIMKNYGIEFINKGARKIPVKTQRYFSEIYSAHQIFGGRQDVLTKLDHFHNTHKSGYFFVTGLSGFGKTALLANWIRTLSSKEVRMVVHFITPLIDASEKFCFQNLCSQLLTIHGLGGELPENERDLRLLYTDLLTVPSSQRIVVVLDGLEEAFGHWELREPRSDMFPPNLGEGVQVIFSARNIADKDWLEELSLDLSENQIISLEYLSLSEIKDILRNSKKTIENEQDMNEIAEQLYDVSEGDPFYLQELLKQIESNVKRFEKPVVGHDRYLKKWWNNAITEVGESAFIDIMGTLLIARTPFNRKELINFSVNDGIRGSNFDLLMKYAAKYVVGNEEDGYQLSHGRIRSFVADRLSDVIESYQESMKDYCMRWADLSLSLRMREYILLHGVYHFSETDRLDELIDFFSPEWIQKKWEILGSYSSLIHDFNLAATVAQSLNPPDYTNIASLTIARQTIREIMQNLPVSLLIAWIRLGDIDRVLVLLETLSRSNSFSADVITSVTRELLNLNDRGDYSDVVFNLLERAISMLNWIRSSKSRLGTFEEIISQIIYGNALKDSQRISLLEQAELFSLSFNDPVLYATALGMVAEGLVSLELEVDKARIIINQARKAIEKINYEADRIVAMAYLLPALTKIDPITTSYTVNTFLETYNDMPISSSYGDSPLEIMLKKWLSCGITKDNKTVKILENISKNSVGEEEFDFSTLWVIVSYLFRTGNEENAIKLINDIYESFGISGARFFFAFLDNLHTLDPKLTKNLLKKAEKFLHPSYYELAINKSTFTGDFVYGLAIIGEWESALSKLDLITHDKQEAIIRLVNLAESSFYRDLSEFHNIIEKLIDLSKDCEDDDRAEIYSTVGQVFIPHEIKEAKKFINKSLGIYLSILPEGSTDNLREILAICLHLDGKPSEASLAIKQMKWIPHKAETYNILIERTSSDNLNTLLIYADDLLHILMNETGAALYTSALQTATRTAIHLVKKGVVPEELCDFVYDASLNLPIDSAIECLAGEAAARVQFDPRKGIRHITELISEVDGISKKSSYRSVFHIRSLYYALKEFYPIEPKKTYLLLEKIHNIENYFSSIDQRIALTSTYIKTLAMIDPKIAVKILKSQLTSIYNIKQDSSHLSVSKVMISELTGKKIGRDYIQVEALREIGETAVVLIKDHPNEIVAILEEIITIIEAIDSAKDQAQALVDFFDYCGKVPIDLQSSLNHCYNTIIELVKTLPKKDLKSFVLDKAVDSFCQFGDLETPNRLLTLVDDENLKNHLITIIENAKVRSEVINYSPLTLLESAYVNTRHKAVAYTCLHSIKFENEEEKDVLSAIADTLVNSFEKGDTSRFKLLEDWVHLLLYPVYTLYGTKEISSIIKGIEDFDKILQQAAFLISDTND